MKKRILFASNASSVGGNTLPEMTKENAISIINSRKLIVEPGKYTLKATNVTPYERPDSGILTNIINYAAMTSYQYSEVKKLFKEMNYQEATNQNLSSSQRLGLDYSPMKGEIVDVVVDYVKTTNYPNGILAVVGVQPLRNKQAQTVSFNPDDDSEENESTTISAEDAATLNRERAVNRAQQKAEAIEAETSLIKPKKVEEAPAV